MDASNRSAASARFQNSPGVAACLARAMSALTPAARTPDDGPTGGAGLAGHRAVGRRTGGHHGKARAA